VRLLLLIDMGCYRLLSVIILQGACFVKPCRESRVSLTCGVREDGQTEGQIHQLKLIKRQMYGRASFALLGKRVLRAA